MYTHAEEDLEREKERPGARTKKRERRGRRLTACSNKGESATCTSAAHNALLLVPPRSLARSLCYLSLILCLSSFPSSSCSCFFSSYYSRRSLLDVDSPFVLPMLHAVQVTSGRNVLLPGVWHRPTASFLLPPLCPPLALPCVTRDLLTATRSFYVGHPVVHLTTVESGERGRGGETMRTTHIVSRAQTVTCFLWNRLGRTAGIQ